MIIKHQVQKVLFIQHGATVMGGVERLLLQITDSYRTKGIQSIVVLPEQGELVTRLNAIGIETRIVPAVLFPGEYELGINQYLSGIIERSQQILQIIKDEDIDIVHTHTVYPFDGALAAHKANIPHIWHVHSNFDIDTTPTLLKAFPLSNENVISLYANLCDTLVGVSSRTLKFFEKSKDLPARVILNALNVHDFDCKAAENPDSDLRDILNISENSRLVGFVGRICEQKDPLTFLYAARIISEKFPHVHFVMIGPPDDHALTTKLKETISSAPCANHFHILGEREDIPALLPQLDVILITSIFEGLAGICLEALAARCPTVSTRCGGSEDVITDGFNGFLVDIGDYRGIAQKAIAILENEELSNNLKAAGRKRVEEDFSWDRFIDQFIELYSELQERHHDIVKTNPALELCFHLIARNASLALKLDNHNNRISELEGFFNRLQVTTIYRAIKYIYKILGGNTRS